VHSAIIKNNIRYWPFTLHYIYGETTFPNWQYSQRTAWTFLLRKLNAIMLLLLLFLVTFFWKNGWSWEKKKS